MSFCYEVQKQASSHSAAAAQQIDEQIELSFPDLTSRYIAYQATKNSIGEVIFLINIATFHPFPEIVILN